MYKKSPLIFGAFLLGLLLGGPSISHALSTYITNQGGTGTSSPSGILYGDNNATDHLNTVTIGTNLTFSGGTLSATGGGDSGTVSTSSQETSGYFPRWTSTNGTPALLSGTGQIFQAGNNIGIGTLVPTDVNANARITVAGIGSQDIIASTTDNTTSSDAILQAYAPGSRVFFGAHGTNQVSSRYGITLGGWGELGAFNSTSGTTNGLIIGTNPAVPLVLGTSNAERVRITSAGLVGIGSTTPWAMLSIHHPAIGLAIPHFVVASSTATATTTEFIVAPDGNVGIGTTTPNATLSVNAAAQTTPYFAIGSSSGNVVSVSPAATPKVGIGTSSPVATLSVTGDVLVDSPTAQGFSVGALGTSTKAFNVDQSAGMGTGISVVTNVPASGVTIQALSGIVSEGVTLASKGGGNVTLNGNAGNVTAANGVALQAAGTTRYQLNANSHTFSATTLTTAATPRFTFSGAADTTLTAATEAPSVYFNSGQVRSHSSNAGTAYPTQRDVRITPSTHTFTAGTSNANSTIASSTALSVDGPPVQGANVNYTNAYGIFAGPGTAYTSASTTNAAAIVAVSPVGAANNYAFIATSSATTTMLLDSSATNKGFCLKVKDLTGTGYTYLTTNAGALVASINSCM